MLEKPPESNPAPEHGRHHLAPQRFTLDIWGRGGHQPGGGRHREPIAADLWAHIAWLLQQAERGLW